MTRLRSSGWLLAAGLATGCYAGLDTEANGTAGPNTGADSDTDGNSDSDDGDSGNSGGQPSAELPAPSARIARLNHAQWENSVQDLLYLDEHTGLSSGFRADPSNSGYLFDNGAAALEVDQVLWSGYQRAAVDVAELAVNTPAVLAAIAPEGNDPATFVREFGLRAFRRPLTEAEVTTYTGMFTGAADLYDDADGFNAGVRLVIETLLQSPHFLYRIERSTESEGDVIALDDYEIAQRLSYLIINSTPDDELLDVAAEGTLSQLDVLEDQARRLLASPRAKIVIGNFHDALFDEESFYGASPNPTFYPDAPADLGELAAEEFHQFLDQVVVDEEGGLDALLTSNVTYVNGDLAAIYGIEGVQGDAFERVELDAQTRRGIFTQIGFLAANATGVDPDPIHRGAFLSERIACSALPPPPDDIPPLPSVSGQTNRESIEELTEEPGSNCAGCHSTFINPMGFPFENYDSTGAFRTHDEDFPVDPATTVILDGEETPVANAMELVDLLASSPAVHACYAKHWVEYASGRPHEDEDDVLIDRLAADSLDGAVSIQDTLISIITSQPFTTRSAFELE